jgi:hypothetical protein
VPAYKEVSLEEVLVLLLKRQAIQAKIVESRLSIVRRLRGEVNAL